LPLICAFELGSENGFDLPEVMDSISDPSMADENAGKMAEVGFGPTPTRPSGITIHLAQGFEIVGIKWRHLT
jgi:hypothetical protein